MHTQPGVADKFINDCKKEVAALVKNPEILVEGKVCQQIYDNKSINMDIIILLIYISDGNLRSCTNFA